MLQLHMAETKIYIANNFHFVANNYQQCLISFKTLLFFKNVASGYGKRTKNIVAIPEAKA